MSEEQKKAHNYFVHGTNDTYTFVLNHYKTSGKYGQRTMEVTDKDVKFALRRWMRHNYSQVSSLNTPQLVRLIGMRENVTAEEAGMIFGDSS